MKNLLPHEEEIQQKNYLFYLMLMGAPDVHYKEAEKLFEEGKTFAQVDLLFNELYGYEYNKVWALLPAYWERLEREPTNRSLEQVQQERSSLKGPNFLSKVF